MSSSSRTDWASWVSVSEVGFEESAAGGFDEEPCVDEMTDDGVALRFGDLPQPLELRARQAHARHLVEFRPDEADHAFKSTAPVGRAGRCCGSRCDHEHPSNSRW
jgi:hypothetical protein